MKKKPAFIAIVSVVLILSMATAAFASSYQTGTIGGERVMAGCNVLTNSGSAYTAFQTSCGGDARVDATYSYINISTLNVVSQRKVKSAKDSSGVDFNAPSNCRSVKITASHRASYSGQTWTTSTSNIR